MSKVKLNDVNPMVGFCLENVPPGSKTAKVLIKGFFTSDEKEFYMYIKQITNLFLNKADLFVNKIYLFLIILHADHTADIYVNDFRVIQKTRLKRSVNAGEKVPLNNVADLVKIELPDILLTESDNIVYCFKIGWKFGLYVNFMQVDGKSKLDAHQLGKELARFYSYLYFEEVYKGFETESIFNELIEDGWFPFIQLIGGDYENILAAYQDKFNFQNKIKGIVDKYDKQAIEGLSSKWWSNPIFSSKRKILQAGLNAYCQADESGYINSIKNIYTETEGILQQTFSPNEKKKIEELCKSLGTSCPEGSLYFSSYFNKYLLKFLYKNFNLENNEVDLSRHTVGHGIAKVEEYDKIRALQGLLILDQIFYYINKQ